MPKRLSKPRRKREDAAQSGYRALQNVIGITEGRRRKDPAAVALGRKGGLKSAIARQTKIAPAERSRIASEAARARWAKEKGGN